MRCGRRIEHPEGPINPADAVDSFDPKLGCSFCGSISPDEVFKAIDDEVNLSPTDKDYKVYVGGRKFYFQHFNEAERDRFVKLLNAGKIKFEYPGRFYVLPFFIARVTDG